MSAATTAHTKIVALLASFSPSPVWVDVYSEHQKANLLLPSLSVEVETDTPLENDKALVTQELVDNRNIRLSIRVHTAYRLAPVDIDSNLSMVDDVINWLRTHINLSDGYRVFDVVGSAYNVEHESSGTSGAEILIDIHKVEYYEQA